MPSGSDQHPSAERGPAFTLAYIAGSGRCGSTLLDLILNGHSQILGCGELLSLNQPPPFARPLDPSDNRAFAFGAVRRHFWQRVRARYRTRAGCDLVDVDLTHPRWRTLLTRSRDWIPAWLERNMTIIECLRDEADALVIVDASKQLQRLYLLLQVPGLDLRVIHLIRDGRAVTNSYLQRYGIFATAIRKWMTSLVAAAILRRRLPTANWLTIRYEDLADRPQETAQRVCVFLELQYEPGMANYHAQPYFGIGGNPGTLQRLDAPIALDESWKRELSWRHRVGFAVLGGWLNFLHGYH